MRRLYLSTAVFVFLLLAIAMTSVFRTSADAAKEVSQEPVQIRIVSSGPTQAEYEATMNAVSQSARIQKFLNGANHRLISFLTLDPDNKGQASLPPKRFIATYYDYTSNRVIEAEGLYAGSVVDNVREAFYQPNPNEEEYEIAAQAVKADSRLGPGLANGSLITYAPMPPVIEDSAVSRGDRIVTVGVMGDGQGDVTNEIVGVNLSRGGIVRFKGNAPPASRADGGECGTVNSAGQSTTSNAVGTYTLTVTQGPTELWNFTVVRPANRSSGTRASGIELRDVKYRGKSVLKRGHAPVLNVKYGQDECGPYRDWQYQEGQFMTPAGSTDLAPGIRMCPSPATTSLENGSDTGNFRGVAIYTQGNETVLVTELEAGWYRYIMEWRLGNDGTIRPRFGFGAVRNGCICSTHHHHVYWRLDFDLVGTNNRVFTSERGKRYLQRQTTEFAMLRNYGTNRRLVIKNGSGNEGYAITPNATDGKADTFGVGDFWVLRYKGTGTTPVQLELDDGYNQVQGSDAFIHIGTMFMNGESIDNQDIVVWYGGHFVHAAEPTDFNPSRTGQFVISGNHVVGPEITPLGW